MSPDELILQAQQYDVTVVPKAEIMAFELYERTIGPLKPLRPSKVPLWLARHLESSNMCSIKIPVYLEEDYVEKVWEREKLEDNFVELPQFFYEHAILFNKYDYIIRDLKRIRTDKIKKGLKTIDGKALYVTGLTRWEFCQLKEYILGILDVGIKLIKQSEKENE